MNMAILEAIRQIARSKRIEEATLIEHVEAAMASASKKSYGPNYNIAVHFDTRTGEFNAFAIKKVVEQVTDPDKELSLSEAREYMEDIELEQEVELPLPPVDFGRIAAQTAKQVVVQRVREAERDMVYNDFKSRQNDIVAATVLRSEGKNVMVDLGETEALLPPKEQVFREDYGNGDRVKVYVVDVRRTSKGPKIIVSRTHPNLVKKLFELEVPEIAEGIVEIKGVAREAGTRTKIAVQSHDSKVDPVGACVGMKGTRVQAIVNEILGEKIDIIPWQEDQEKFIIASLSPAKISRVVLDEAQHAALVLVPEDQLSLAIGKKGQNVRLAAKLTGWRVDIKSEAQLAEEQLRAAQAALAGREALAALPGVGEKTADRLVEQGYGDLATLAAATVEQLSQVEGIGEATAEKILEAAKAAHIEAIAQAEADAKAAAEAAVQAAAQAEADAKAEALSEGKAETSTEA
jgi:N utilization substance protein A